MKRLGLLAVLLLAAGCAEGVPPPNRTHSPDYLTPRAPLPAELAEARRAEASGHETDAPSELLRSARRDEAGRRAASDREIAEHTAADAEARRAKADRRAELERLSRTPEVAVPGVSALICNERKTLAALDQDMRREVTITRAAGVVDLSNRRAIAENAIDTRARIVALASELQKRFRAAPLPCQKVAAIAACLDDRDACTDETKLYREIQLDDLEAR